MPLPHPPGYRPSLQRRMDRRRVMLAAVLMSFLAAVLLLLGCRAAAHAANQLFQPSLQRTLVVVLAAGACGAWGETMRQLSAVAQSNDPGGVANKAP
jgi:H+/gluconate symporter-like permease